jgi:hypothetical protein
MVKPLELDAALSELSTALGDLCEALTNAASWMRTPWPDARPGDPEGPKESASIFCAYGLRDLDRAEVLIGNALELLRQGAGSAVDQLAGTGVHAWSARMYQHLESIPRGWEEGQLRSTLFNLKCLVDEASSEPEWNLVIRAARHLFAATGPFDDHIDAVDEGLEELRETLANQDLCSPQIQSHSPDSETPPFRLAAWFDKATGGQLNSDTLRKAGADGRLQRERVQGRWHYPVPQARKCWPHLAAMIDQALAREEEAGRKRNKPEI